MKKNAVAFSELEVRLSHPWLSDFVPLDMWIELGPGVRDRVGPLEVRHSQTEESLPISVIPLRFRNSMLSRLLIRWGLLKDPWNKNGPAQALSREDRQEIEAKWFEATSDSEPAEKDERTSNPQTAPPNHG